MTIKELTVSEENAHKERCHRLGILYRPRPTIPDPPVATTLAEQLREQRLVDAVGLVCDADGIQSRYAPELLKQARELGLRGGQIDKLKVLGAQFLAKNSFAAVPKPKEPVVVPPPLTESERRKLTLQKETDRITKLNSVDPEAYNQVRLRAGLPAVQLTKIPLPIADTPLPAPKSPFKSPADLRYEKLRESAGLPPPNHASTNDWARRQGTR